MSAVSREKNASDGRGRSPLHRLPLRGTSRPDQQVIRMTQTVRDAITFDGTNGIGRKANRTYVRPTTRQSVLRCAREQASPASGSASWERSLERVIRRV